MAPKINYMSKVEIHINDIEQNPCCPHGPSVLFERIFQDGRRKKFYACSACRDRKLCPFYLEEEQIVKRNEKTTDMQKESSCFNNHATKFKIYLKLLSRINKREVYYCETCNMLIADNSKKDHDKCNLSEILKEKELRTPSHIFSPKSESKFQAQYFFTDESLKVIVQLMNDLEIKKVLCIGVPSVYEYVKNNLSMKTFLLDIDDRYCNFFSTTDFCVYNMFNHYFFGGHKSREVYEDFLKENPADKLLVIIDPPFGGRVELISNTLSTLEKEWKRLNNISGDKTLPVALIFPYFHEKTS
ncbi:Zinc finger CCHC domain-containing protein 4 [Armadillidium nasatum]|uniref:Zinc finger CCHC domain-containing protein 4 n=1 Tax=Armadillidium nasatum TaxID=96803 RepID=A0A5N5THG9_9CRUS|nr:Zinc finger CCHC domain-containing protein 4 [Armadillidium nasatum]